MFFTLTQEWLSTDVSVERFFGEPKVVLRTLPGTFIFNSVVSPDRKHQSVQAVFNKLVIVALTKTDLNSAVTPD